MEKVWIPVTASLGTILFIAVLCLGALFYYKRQLQNIQAAPVAPPSVNIISPEIPSRPSHASTRACLAESTRSRASMQSTMLSMDTIERRETEV